MRVNHGWRAAAAALVLSLSAALPAAADLREADCVEIPKPVSAKAVAALNAVSNVRDVDNVTIMQLDGDYSRSNTAPRQQVALKFYADHPDTYDFLIVFTTFEFDTGDRVRAFYNQVKNDVTGLGAAPLDLTQAFGSAGRLQGYIDMAAIGRMADSPANPRYENDLNTLAHETLHRWGITLHYRDAGGGDSTALLGQDGAHWSYFLDTDASVMYGSDWRQRGDGRFEAVATSRRYSPLDLYVAGFAAASEVPPMTLIRNGDGNATDFPLLGAVSGGTAETVTIEQIVAANGPRVPSAADSPKDFRAAIVLLTRPGEAVPPSLLYRLETFRTRFQQRFAQMTDGRGLMRIFTERKNATAALPQILAGSGIAATPPGVPAAAAWLEARQKADGHWEDRPATALRDTVAAMRALEQIAPASAAIAKARAWIASRTVANLDQRAWQHLATRDTTQRDALTAAQASDGGWPLAAGWPSSPLDTATVADLLARAEPDAVAVDQALAWLAPRQNTDGSFGMTDGGRGRMLPTLRAARLLEASDVPAQRDAAQRAGDWLGTRRIIGGFGDNGRVSLTDTIELYAMVGQVPLPDAGVTTARSVVRARQQIDGDWGGSVYLTATAALASSLDLRVNFALAAPPTATPAAPADGDRVLLAATVVNTGTVAAPASVARWYDGDLAQGGTPIGADITVPALAPGARATIQKEWDTTNRSGAHTLHLVLDADATVSESREDDNVATLPVTVGNVPAGPDLQLLAGDFTLDPPSVDSLPKSVHLTGIVRNTGNTTVSGARIVVNAVAVPGTALASTTVDVPARGSAPVDLTFTVANTSQLLLAVRADPDGAIAEASETNNEARLTLSAGASIDLAITPADLSLAGPAVAGRDVNLRVVVRNRGTVAAPPVRLHLEVTKGAATTTVLDTNVSLPAGAAVERVVPWRAGEVGPAIFRATIDSDDRAVESDETNNAAQIDFTIEPLQGVDLAAVPSTLAFTPTPGVQGKPLLASLRVRNNGTAATSPFTVALFAGDPRVGALRLGATVVDGLAEGADTVVAIDVADLDLRGDQNLFVMVDADGVYAEDNENDNVAIQLLPVTPLPDLVIGLSDIALTPALPAPGTPTLARVTVRNLGGQDAQNVVVRLSEGDAAASTPIGERAIAVVPAHGSADVDFNWTLGVQSGARAVTAVADPAGTVREFAEDNNAATLPFDVQNGNFYASESYISPNGDGVRDETAIVFRLDSAQAASVRVVNRFDYVVRTYASVETNPDLRGQIIWDGRDDRGRIVVDGDYRVQRVNADGAAQSDIAVTVDNNRSTVLSAVGTRYALEKASPLGLNVVPPFGNAWRSNLFGLRQYPEGVGMFRVPVTGIYRIEPLTGQISAVVSSRWSHERNGDVQAFVFSPDGGQIAFDFLDDAGRRRVWRANAALNDVITPLQTPTDTIDRRVIGFFDENEVLLRREQGYDTDIVDVRTMAMRSFRELNYHESRLVMTPHGVLLADTSEPRYYRFEPRDSQRPAIDLEPRSPEPGDYYKAALSPDASKLLFHKRTPLRESVELIDLATGGRRMLVDRPNDAFPSVHFREAPGGVATVRELAFEWVSQLEQIVIVDGRARRLQRYSYDGAPLGEVALPPVDRVGPYQLDPAVSLFVHAFAAVADPADSNIGCFDVARSIPTELKNYDPLTESLNLALTESIGVRQFGSEDYPYYLDGIRHLVSAGVEHGRIRTLARGSATPLTFPADAAAYPLKDCVAEAPEWPILILRDGARLFADGRVEGALQGGSQEPWPLASSVSEVWSDQSQLTAEGKTVVSLLNGTAMFDAGAYGTSIRLSGYAVDRNFAYYELDYASTATPAEWHPLTSRGSNEVIDDEFLTWLPPEPGVYTIRLRVVDKAGNVVETTRVITSLRGASIERFALAPRYLSPNGDGVQDRLNLSFRVRQPVSLRLVVKREEDGAVVYDVEHSYGAGDIGDQALSWDGRDSGGNTVPDGRYRVELGDFGATIVVDTVAPVIRAAYNDIYPGGPEYAIYPFAFVETNPTYPRYKLEAISVFDGSVRQLPVRVNENVSVPVRAYATSSIRISADDLAGNHAERSFPRGPEALYLYDTSTLSAQELYHQPRPFDDFTGVRTSKAVPLEEEGRPTEIIADPAVANLETVGLQFAPLDRPDEWTETFRGPLHPSLMQGTSLESIGVSATTQGLVRGNDYFMRLVGERTDGSAIASNVVLAHLGGIGRPDCPDNVRRATVDDYNEGTLREALLHYRLDRTNDPFLVQEAEFITAEQAAFGFNYPSGVYEVYATAVDQAGRKHTSEHATCVIRDHEPTIAFEQYGPFPVAAERCDGEPTYQVGLRAKGKLSLGVAQGYAFVRPQQLRWRYTNGQTLLEATTPPVDVLPTTPPNQIEPQSVIDTHGWPVGTYPAALEGGYRDANGGIVWQTFVRTILPVERDPPAMTLIAPRAGDRLCINQLDERFKARISSPTLFGYRIRFASSEAPGEWGKAGGDGLEYYENASGTDFNNVSKLTPLSIQPENALILGELHNGRGTMQLAAVNYSGGPVCTTVDVEVDAAVDFEERSPPLPLISVGGEPETVISPGLGNNFSRARLLLRAREVLDVHAEVRESRIGSDRLIGVLLDASAVNGDFDVEWDGREAGAIVPDGLYEIRVTVVDACGLEKELSRYVKVKTTPPSLAFHAPESGALIHEPIVDVRGTVIDRYLDRWSLEVSVGSDAWQPIDGDDRQRLIIEPYPVPQLAAWPRGQLTGPIRFRLSARDLLGNADSILLPLMLDSPPALIGGARINPVLFSPNADGVLDATRLELTLLRASTIKVDVRNSAASTVATLYDGPLGAETRAWPWDGRNGGAALPEGEYTIAIDAVDPTGIMSPEHATVAATIDTTAPAVALVAPTAGFIRPEQSIRFTVDDIHLVAWDATLTRGGSTVAATQGAVGGELVISVPAGAPEGAYSLRITARDGAGNRTEKTVDFTLDSKPPTVGITAPAEQAVVPSATPTPVRGTAKDENFAKYTLEIAPAIGDTWQPLATGTAPIDAAEVLSWTPNRPDGDYRLRLHAEDKAGNMAEAVRAVTVDGTPPVASITVPAAGDYVRREFDVMGSATDAHFAEYRVALIRASALPNGAWSDVKVGTEPVDASLLAKIALTQPTGDYVLRLTVKDLAGLTSTTQVSVKLDAEPPATPLQLTGRVENNRHARLAWNAVTADDLAGYHVYRGGARITTAPVTPTQYTDTDAPEGSLVYTVTAVDHAGNESAPSNAVTLLVDHTAPTVNLARPADGERVRAAYDIAGTAWSRDDFHEYRLILEPLAPPGAPVVLRRGSLPVQSGTLAAWNTLDFADETRVRVRLEADDRNGNTASAQVEVTVDNGPPTAPTGVVAALADAPGAPCAALGGTGRDVRVCWNANTESDLLGYLVYRDGKLLDAPLSLPADLRPFAIAEPARLDAAVADGAHTYVVHAIDRAGNISAPSDPAELAAVDFGPPHVEFDRPVAGTEFDVSLAVRAVTDHRDIATVQFAYKHASDATWTDLGSAFTAEPYNLTWTPDAIPYGDYDLRAIATDTAGQVDPAPPVVRVKYADLTPPAAPTTLVARADGGTVSLTWTASASTDVARYAISRYDLANQAWYPLGDATAVTYDDIDLDDGSWRYRVEAIDTYGNRSVPSNEATPYVFSLALKQPFTPTTEASVAVTGRSGRTGSLVTHVDNAQGSTDLPAAALDEQGNIALAPIALQPGSTHLTFRVTDAQGNRSRAAELWIDRGAMPATPTGLAANANGHDVTVSWNANPEPDIAGYRVFRRGQAAPIDVPLAETPTAESLYGWSPESAVDGDPATAWELSHSYDGAVDDDSNDPSLTLSWATPRLVAAANLTWLSAAQAAGNIDLQGWSGHAWITIASVRGTATATGALVPAAAYRTDKVRLVLRNPGHAADVEYRLAEIALVERPLLDATSVTDTLIDGRYDYRVSAVNNYGFESDRTEPVTVDVGDAEPPAAVVLSGTLAGNTAHLTWTASASADVAHYELRRDGTMVADIPAASPLAYDDAGLRNGPHTWLVVAYDAFDNASEPSNAVTLTVTESGPGIPVVRIAAPAAGGMLDIAWDAGAGTVPVRYVLRRATSAAGPFVETETLSATTYRDAPLVNGTTYWYTVEAIDAIDNASGPSAPASGTPRDVLSPPAPLLGFPTVANTPATMHLDATRVCGMAEPGSRVAITRDGLPVGEASATSVRSETTIEIDGITPRSVVVAGDGRTYVVERWSGQITWHDLQTGATGLITSAGENPRWAARGLQLYYKDQAGNAIVRFEPGRAPEPLGLAVENLREFDVDEQGRQVLFAGDFATSGAAERGVWLANADGTSARRIEGIDADSLNQRGLRFSPDRDLALISHGDVIDVIDTRTTQIVGSHEAPSFSAPAWASGGRYAYGTINAEDAIDVVIRDAATGSQRTLLHGIGSYNGVAWSPDETRLLVIRQDGYDAVDANTGASTIGGGATGISADVASWSASERLVLWQNATLRLIDLPGGFCSDPVALSATRHVFGATARDASGNTSLPAATLEVLREAQTLPDFAIGASDILVVPVDARPGDSASALVTVRNAGGVASPASVAQAMLVAPDGTTRPLTMPPVPALAAGAASVSTVDLGVLDAAGTWRVRVVLDPNSQVTESNETNNRAEALVVVTADDAPTLEVHADRTLFAPGDTVTGEVAVAGIDAAARVRVAVVDAAGDVVDELGEFAVSALGRGERWTRVVQWNAAGVVAGDYRLRARLLAAAGNTVQLERYGAFQLQSLRHVALSVQPAANSATVGTLLSVRSVLAFTDGNAPIDGAQLRLAAVQPAGGEIVLAEQALGTLLAGYEIHKDDNWNTAGLAPGVYGLRLRLTAPGFQTVLAESSVTLDAAVPVIAVAGMLDVAPDASLVAGMGGELRYVVRNRGEAALAGITARVRVAAAGTTTPVAQTQETFDLAAGADRSGTLALATPPLLLGTYSATLEARLAGDAPDTWRVLARAGVSVVDAVPPEVTLMSPAANTLQPAVFKVRAVMLDRHSSIAAGEFRIDGGAWQPIGLGDDGYYARGVSGLADGTHRIALRARDAWGNETLTAGTPFTVDATPPTVVIAGVTDGDIVNVVLAPTVTITDANPGTNEVRLNGAPYVSGTTIAADGEYLLSARATDAAGNVTYRSVRFTIDRTPPTVTIASPADGAVVGQSTIAVAVNTEGLATATLTVGAWQGDAVADAAGVANFANVPLAPGDNTLTAGARDRAGNDASPASVHVRYQPDQALPLVGTLQPGVAQLPHGDALAVNLSAVNPGTVPLAAQRLRVQVLAGINLLAEEFVTHDFAASETYATDFTFASTAWPLGRVDVMLAVERDGGWAALDSEPVDVVDRTLPVLTALAPAAGAVIRAPVTVRAGASDALSGIATAEARVDSGTWAALTVTTPGEYTSTPLKLADADHTVELRATDGAGNVREIPAIAFAVDNASPTITVTGVADGDLLAHAVTPTITISDAHPDTSTTTLNGAPYVSGTPLMASGAYALHVEAIDRAGNTAQANVAFTLDLDTPTLVVTSPADGATVNTATITVTGTTEPLAKVEIAVGTFAATVFADANGAFSVPGVTLAEGANTVTARPTDRAGNVGSTVSLVVHYVPVTVPVLTGEFDAVADSARIGPLFEVRYFLHNPTTAVASNVPVRITLTAVGAATPAVTQAFDASVAAQGTQSGAASLDTRTLTTGHYVLQLEAFQTSGAQPAWQLLDDAPVYAYDRCRRPPTPPSFDSLYANTFDLPDPLFCDGFDDWRKSEGGDQAARESPPPVPWLGFARHYALAPRAPRAAPPSLAAVAYGTGALPHGRWLGALQ